MWRKIHFAKSVNSNVVQDKTNYDAILNNVFVTIKGVLNHDHTDL